MAPKEPTRYQLSSRLTYDQQTPAFLRRLQNRVSGIADEDENEDEEYEEIGSGRPPIPKRPAIPERPPDNPGSGDEDDGDEKPQVVVLKEGKHLTQMEVENERRRAKGLPPLPNPSTLLQKEEVRSAATQNERKEITNRTQPEGLSFSSKSGSSSSSKKRKALGDGQQGGHTEKYEKTSKKGVKKAKKEGKTLLSFGDDM